jgi:hypothetical protein
MSMSRISGSCDKNVFCCWALVTHPVNLATPGSKDQENRSSKPAWANSLRDPISKKPFTKIELVKWLKVKALSLELLQYRKKYIFYIFCFIRNCQSDTSSRVPASKV